MAIWLIRAGSHGEYEQKFIQENRVYVTWDGLDVDLDKCCIPSDHIPLRSWPLFRAREVMRGLIETLKAKQAT